MATVTDSTTTLTTAWTEQSLGVFTAGVLSTMATCVSEVESKLKRGTLDAGSTPSLTQVENWLRRAKMEIAEAFGFDFTRKYASCTLTANTYVYSLPPDFHGGRVRLKDTTNNLRVEVYTPETYDRTFPDPSEETSGKVSAACIKNMELWVAPPPDSSDTLEIEYPRSGAETTTNDFTWLPELMRYRCCDLAIAEAYEALLQYDVSDRYRMKYEAGMQKARVAEGRKRWQGKMLSCQNVFQAYIQKNNQPG